MFFPHFFSHVNFGKKSQDSYHKNSESPRGLAKYRQQNKVSNENRAPEMFTDEILPSYVEDYNKLNHDKDPY